MAFRQGARMLLLGAAASLENSMLMIDMVQNNPGDPVAWQQSAFLDPAKLRSMGYNGQTTTGEMSGTQAVDFSSLGHDFFPAGTPERRWLDAYAAGVKGFVHRAVAAGVEPYFFVDLLVFPRPVLAKWPNATKGGNIIWNEASQELLRVLVRETFAAFPEVAGWIVRTGETYVYDTPYHVGNSPNNNTVGRWAEFITFLREEVCVKQQKRLLMRQWDNWPSDAKYYEQIAAAVPTHELLYFSIKHSAHDFTRPAVWNPTLGVGEHAQIVEVELQREYEGKGAFPNYVMDGVIDGFPEMSHKVGLSSLLGKRQLRGLWTWTRGGGWWGPYVHGNEAWLQLHAETLARWWQGNFAAADRGRGKSEPQAFREACEALFPGCDAACCAAMRNVTQAGALSVLHGQWGTIAPPGLWMRDDRIGGMDTAKAHFAQVAHKPALFQRSMEEKAWARANFAEAKRVWQRDVAVHLTDSLQRDKLDATVEYGVLLYEIVDASWRVMGQGYLKEAKSGDFDEALLRKAIADYDAAWAAYRAFGLANVLAPSLYHPYYLCLGNQCNCAFQPLDAGDHSRGIGATVDRLRRVAATLVI